MIFLICMKKIISLSSFCLTLLALVSVFGAQTACKKQDTTCTAVVYVRDSVNNPVQGAAVKLYAPNSTAGSKGTTGRTGSVTFTFSLPAIFYISASKGIAANDTLKGTGLIQLQIGESVSGTVTIK